MTEYRLAPTANGQPSLVNNVNQACRSIELLEYTLSWSSAEEKDHAHF